MQLQGKKVIVTGACGFIGSHLVERLLDEGCKVRAFVFYNSFNSWGWLDDLAKDKLKKIDIFSGDVRDPNGVRSAMKGMDVVFHLAALIGIPFSYRSPDSYIDTNVKGTLNILQAARDIGTEKVIVTSTSEVYGTAKYAPIDEAHPLQGQSPYSASKIGADMLAESFRLSFDLPITIVRPFNTFGPRQSVRAVIPTVITQALAGMKTINLGSLAPTRDFNYVRDTCDGFIAIAKCDKAIGEVVNIASQTEVSIGQIARKILEQIGSKARIVHDGERVRPCASEVMRLLGSNEKIRRLTAWEQAYSLDKGIEETISWFRIPKHMAFYKRTEVYAI